MNLSSTAKAWELSRATTLVPSIASSESHPDMLPSDQDAQELTSSSVAKIEKRLKQFRPLLKPKSQRRVVLGIALKSSGSTLTSSGDSGNLGATSTTLAKLSVHLDQILQQTEGKPISYALNALNVAHSKRWLEAATASDSLLFSTYLEKQQSIPIHRFCPQELHAFHRLD